MGRDTLEKPNPRRILTEEEMKQAWARVDKKKVDNARQT